LFVQTDIGTADGVRKVVDRIQQEWHGLDILVNCLGGSEAPNGGFRALTDDDWQRALNVICWRQFAWIERFFRG